MANSEFKEELSPLRLQILQAYRMDETKSVDLLLQQASFDDDALASIKSTARQLICELRGSKVSGLDAFLFEYDLSSEEGIALMCLAEALLRIPDKSTAYKIIADKLPNANWDKHLGLSDSNFVNYATRALQIGSKFVSTNTANNVIVALLKKIVHSMSEPVIMQAISKAMHILGGNFVIGEDIYAALARGKKTEQHGFLYSYDMLGEAACTKQDAHEYYTSYALAIEELGKHTIGKDPIASSGISIKLSALHPTYRWSKKSIVIAELLPQLRTLILLAKKWDIGLTIDAEEAETLDLSLELFAKIASMPELTNWRGLGIAVQAYQKRAPFVIDWIIAIAKQHKIKIMVRLVKGAYWDSEIKKAQEFGLHGYPVFTRKYSTDVSYLVCAKKLFLATWQIYAQFATHNAYTVAAILELAKHTGVAEESFEFQCLHGMGENLYRILLKKNSNLVCRIYAPVGKYDKLLAYLVRRLLENGANTSFVNMILDKNIPVDDLILDPCQKLAAVSDKANTNIVLPEHLYVNTRPNSQGIDINNCLEVMPILNKIEQLRDKQTKKYQDDALQDSKISIIYDPSNVKRVLGKVSLSGNNLDSVLQSASKAHWEWAQQDPTRRAACLEKMALLLEEHKVELMHLLICEAGKTIPDAIAELREAIDFCWYYAQQSLQLFKLQDLPGPTGEVNRLKLIGRGVIICISPWNFPLAIFTGQIVAALVVGNSVIAKPALQTPLIAIKVVQLLYDAGIPKEVLQVVCGGQEVGQALVESNTIAGVIFTGSTKVAKIINQSLANRQGAIVPLIAETGGLNAMIVDSSALLEQVIADVIISAFGSAGQRCSCLRVLFIQDDIADIFINMLQGAMLELKIGDPLELSTDIGPIIDQTALQALQQHVMQMQQTEKLIFAVPLTDQALLEQGNFFAPCVFEISSMACLTKEIFGPILHLVRYKSKALDQIIDEINNSGYGLTLGIHSRINSTVEYICARARVGNMYVNRNMVGAVVGVQPFGGEGLSGTGPKAGGPNYLSRLVLERVISTNTAAVGGNAALLGM